MNGGSLSCQWKYRQPATSDISMNLIDQINRQLSSLPKEAQVEVLDFVGYLASKYRTAAPTEDEAWDQFAAHDAPVGDSAKRRG